MIVWGLDRFLRLVNLSVFNFGYLNPWSQTSKDLDASVEVLSARFLKVTIYRSTHFHWRPGQSAYLTFPSVSTFPFQSHPFTISTIEDDATAPQKKLSFFIRVRTGFTKTLMQTASSDATYKVFINGPYSSPPVLMGYQTVILIAGLYLGCSEHCSFQILTKMSVYRRLWHRVYSPPSFGRDMVRIMFSFSFDYQVLSAAMMV